MTAAAEPPSSNEMRPMVPPGSWVLVRLMRRRAIGVVGEGLLMMACGAAAQDQTAPDSQQTQATPQLPRVTTTVEVHADTKNNYLPETVTAGTRGPANDSTRNPEACSTRCSSLSTISRIAGRQRRGE